jgi:glycosyltransferase involved in cell wall biosynthesis
MTDSTSPAAANAPLRTIALIGNHLPRRCGIATFTGHLADALSGDATHPACFVVAMNDGLRHEYPARVQLQIAEGSLAAYRRAAEHLNASGAEVVSLQHEYGIFGGTAGGHLLTLLRHLDVPVVTTLHTILSAPDPEQRAVLDEVIHRSHRVVVMSEGAAELLRQVHAVPAATIDVIPHGIPAVPSGAEQSKGRLGLDGKTVLLTFGLLSAAKGIEFVIDALPAIRRAHPETVYVVLGATHPHVVARDGESYRRMLEARAAALGVAEHVIFEDRFVPQEELVDYLSAADIYITPYLQPHQIASGTLAYAVGAGKAIISTPYSYAREMLADGRGVLVPWRDAEAIGAEAIGLMDDAPRRIAIARRGAEYGQAMLWPAVAARYLASFARARDVADARRRLPFRNQTLQRRLAALPATSLAYVQALTDDTGMLQHAVFAVPRYAHGYCVDDNARALALMARIEEAGADTAARALATRYLAFVGYAYDEETGRFRNFLDYSRRWSEGPGSEDSHGRALHALGVVAGRSRDHGHRRVATDLFVAALRSVRQFRSPRAWAFTLLGIDELRRLDGADRQIAAMGDELASRLAQLFARVSRPDWRWCEDRLTYCNAQLPAALIVSGAWLERPDMVATGTRALAWLASVQRTGNGGFAPIGSNGFFTRGGTPARFDQQPVEAASMVAACLDAARIDDPADWRDLARSAFNWFLGGNHLGASLYDPITRGCRDGLHADRVNENQGAESTLAFLTALTDMRAFDRLADRPSAAAPVGVANLIADAAAVTAAGGFTGVTGVAR